MNTQLIQHAGLRQVVAHGLNHILIMPTSIAKCMSIVMDAFEQVSQILNFDGLDFPTIEAKEWLHNKSLQILKATNRQNLYGLRFLGRELMSEPAVKNELDWITDNLFCSGLDKASNNCCFICIKHIRIMALERLSSPDFQPCKDDDVWLLPSHMLEKIEGDLTNLVPEINTQYQALPYMMATYKMHKKKYRWLTNAAHTVFSGIAHMLTIATMLILEFVKNWAAKMAKCYQGFFQVKTSIFWLVNSAIEVALNLPENITDVFVADIIRCYKSILFEGDDNLLDAIAHIIKLGSAQ